MKEIEIVIHNERRKLFAQYLNGLAVAIFAIGGLGALIQNMKVVDETADPGWQLFIPYAVAALLSLGTHLFARSVLGGIR